MFYSMLNIYHLYPDLLNLYGDRGNVIALVQRCRWRNIPVAVHKKNIGENLDFQKADILFLGGGSDREQNLIAADMNRHKKALKDAIEEGLVMLAVCGGYQLLGRYYLTPDGTKIPGLSILDFYTKAGKERLIGNIVLEISIGDQKFKVTGFENHGGRTYLGNISPFGKVLSGYGNNGHDGLEGARYKNVFCTYLHGPLLPKNPALTDYLILTALKRRGFGNNLAPLDDTLEQKASEVIIKRIL